VWQDDSHGHRVAWPDFSIFPFWPNSGHHFPTVNYWLSNVISVTDSAVVSCYRVRAWTVRRRDSSILYQDDWRHTFGVSWGQLKNIYPGMNRILNWPDCILVWTETVLTVSSVNRIVLTKGRLVLHAAVSVNDCPSQLFSRNRIQTDLMMSHGGQVSWGRSVGTISINSPWFSKT
jgi:hypothetical protein